MTSVGSTWAPFPWILKWQLFMTHIFKTPISLLLFSVQFPSSHVVLAALCSVFYTCFVKHTVCSSLIYTEQCFPCAFLCVYLLNVLSLYSYEVERTRLVCGQWLFLVSPCHKKRQSCHLCFWTVTLSSFDSKRMFACVQHLYDKHWNNNVANSVFVDLSW